jgi:hypothetical protein
MDNSKMKHHIPDIIRKNSFDCFKSLNEAERAVVMFGEEEYRKSLDLEMMMLPVGRYQVESQQPLLVGTLCVSQQWIT